jgi:hypothetical protein
LAGEDEQITLFKWGADYGGKARQDSLILGPFPFEEKNTMISGFGKSARLQAV